VPVQPPDITGAEVDDAESLIPPSLAPRRQTMGAREEVPHGLAVVADRLLLHDHTARSQPRGRFAGFGQLAAPARKSWHAPSGMPP